MNKTNPVALTEKAFMKTYPRCRQGGELPKWVMYPPINGKGHQVSVQKSAGFADRVILTEMESAHI